jgi:tripartite-type tricarboxylate transporter receptor subunit TctC
LRGFDNVSRRTFTKWVGALGSIGGPRVAAAQLFPQQPLRWLVGFAPGGASSIVTRIVAQRLAERLSQPVVVENKPGASGLISAEAVIAAPADGHTLLFFAASSLIAATMLQKQTVDLVADLAPVCGLIEFPLALIVNAKVPARNVAEFVAYAKTNPGKVNIASFGTGSSSHLAAELFKMMTGIESVHIPYTGEALALGDMIDGRIDAMFNVLGLALQHVQTGKLRILGVAGQQRYAKLPEVPTIGETVAGYAASSWAGVAVRVGTPLSVIENLSREIKTILGEPEIKARLEDVAAVPLPYDAEDFGRYITAEIAKWTNVIKFAGLKIN